jgi:hypothetical protein
MEAQTNTGNVIHVGQLLKAYINKNRIFKSSVARKLGKEDSEILRYQKSVALKTDLLLALSHILKHNFFLDIAALLPNSYSTDAPQDLTKDNRIAELELQVKLLEAEKGVLIAVMRK